LAPDNIPVPSHVYVTGLVVVNAITLAVVIEQFKLFVTILVTIGTAVFCVNVTTAEFVQPFSKLVVTNV
jgi:hypothetical protein